MRVYIPCSVVLATFLVVTTSTDAANIADFADYSLKNSSGQVLLPGRLFTPPEAISDPSVTRPLMVYLHGGGAIGTDNTTQIAQTPDFMVDEAKRRGAYLYVPQTSTTWASTSVIDLVMTMINRAVAEKGADLNRLYAAGYSNGGGGVWTLLNRNHGKFAAALTLAGIVPASGFQPSNLLGTAILTLHARDDATVPVARTRTIVDGILTAAGEPVPNYSALAAEQILLVSNPNFEFHRLVAGGNPPELSVNHFISRPDLDLMYLETPNGGHTGLLGIFFLPEVYDWVYSHSLITPEPPTLVLAAFAVLLIRSKRAHF